MHKKYKKAILNLELCLGSEKFSGVGPRAMVAKVTLENSVTGPSPVRANMGTSGAKEQHGRLSHAAAI
eukprot:3923375-Amphidinium_carterae.1